MTAPLISDATLAKIVRMLWSDDPRMVRIRDEDRCEVVGMLVAEKYAEALGYVGGLDVIDDPLPMLWGEVEEANEEAARTHDERERGIGNVTLTAKHPIPWASAPLGDIITDTETALNLLSAACQRLTRERDESRAELAALKRGAS